jgi:hypothetical protein
MTRQYLSGAETAKLMRLALKESFPGVKFSVRSDYNSVNVRWTDGPNAKMVEAVADNFQGGYFDGMIDYAGSVYHLLDGKPVQFSKYVFCTREDSPEAIAKAIEFLKGKYPNQIGDDVTPENFKAGKLNRVFPCGGDWSWENSLQQMIWKAAAKRSSVAAPEKSATLERIKFQGDDGYGQGTVGMDGKGGNNAAKGQQEALARQAAQRAADAKVAAAEAADPVVAVIAPELVGLVDPNGALRAAGLVKVLQ